MEKRTVLITVSLEDGEVLECFAASGYAENETRLGQEVRGALERRYDCEERQ